MKNKIVLMTSSFMALGLLAGCGHTHNYGEVTYTWSSDYKTCTAERVCLSDDGHNEIETVSSTYAVIKDAGCEEDGTIRYTASFENEAFGIRNEDVAIEATGHSLVAHAASEPTCTENGSCPYWSCENCDEFFSDKDGKNKIEANSWVIPAHHNLIYHAGEPATCDEDGLIEYWTCTVCEKDFFDTNGSREITHEDDYIEPAHHTLTHHDAVMATCTETGTIEYWTCDVCDKYFSDEDGANEINSSSLTAPAKGHIWGTPTYEWSSDYSKCTAKKVCANDSTHVIAETVNATIGDDVSASGFDNPVLNMTVTAEFEDSDFADQSETVSTKYNGQIPLFNSDETLVKYGLYPQRNVNDPALIAALDELEDVENNGWYLYEGEYYTKTVSDPYHVFEYFDNGVEIEYAVAYWFKCEPIVWNVLSNDEGEYYLLSSVLLDFQTYDADGDNHYVDSDIRAWLNGDFCNQAFGLEDSYIKTTTVDNSAATTDWLPEDYSCDNTKDKVFLPSYKDYLNPAYGFTSSVDETKTRECRTTDWARATGAYFNATTYNGNYWTRSPEMFAEYPTYYDDVECVLDDGYIWGLYA